MAIFEDRPICDECGNRIISENVHPEVCDPDPAFDGVCPMCEQPYEAYIQHLSECPADRE